jgi:hypothetical protein
MLWFKTFYEAVGLPKLNGVAINGDFCEPPRLFLIKAADINPIDNVVVGFRLRWRMARFLARSAQSIHARRA